MLCLVAACLLSLAPTDPHPQLDDDWAESKRWAEEHPISLMRVELTTPGGPLPFVVEFVNTIARDPDPQSDWTSAGRFVSLEDSLWFNTPWFNATIHNGNERTPVRMRIQGGGYGGPSRAWIIFPEYASLITAFGTGSCTTPSLLPRHYLRWGDWSISRKDDKARLEVRSYPVAYATDRFDPAPDAGEAASFTGRWSVDFSSTDNPAVGVFTVDADQIAAGTFLTPTGDYRYLAGRVDGDLMRLSTFDGAHAFLFHARMQEDGTIEGDFWSGNWHHETWTAVRDDGAALPDAFGQTTVTGVGVEELAFRDLEGAPTRVVELLDAGGAPARVLYLFGSWCPNCADAGAEMKRLKGKYGDRLTVVGLAFELTEDFERSARQVGLYLERHEADWPVLIAGLSDKAKASAELPVLDRVRAYPTTVFLDADNQIVAVHTGFSGPATGEAYREQQKAFEGVVEGLIGP